MKAETLVRRAFFRALRGECVCDVATRYIGIECPQHPFHRLPPASLPDGTKQGKA